VDAKAGCAPFDEAFPRHVRKCATRFHDGGVHIGQLKADFVSVYATAIGDIKKVARQSSEAP
jgi:hypothetical protein